MVNLRERKDDRVLTIGNLRSGKDDGMMVSFPVLSPGFIIFPLARPGLWKGQGISPRTYDTVRTWRFIVAGQENRFGIAIKSGER